MNIQHVFLVLLLILLTGKANCSDSQDATTWPGNKQFAISLSYDDALDSQLDNAVPQLTMYGYKASFYVYPASEPFQRRLSEWKLLAQQGHELGNHSLYHPCRGSLPNREWVEPHKDLDKYSIKRILLELDIANLMLNTIDGKNLRTYTIPCGDTQVTDGDYYGLLAERFLAVKGEGVAEGYAILYTPSNVSGEELINYVKSPPAGIRLINILFHGVGGDHLSVSSEAHQQLLAYLATNENIYWIDTYQNIMRHKKTKN